MTYKEKKRLSRRIERGLYQLYHAGKRARIKARKLFAAYEKTMQIVDDYQEQRLLLMLAQLELWEE